MSNFQKTVNLRSLREKEQKQKELKKQKNRARKSQAIDEVFSDENREKTKKDLHSISVPQKSFDYSLLGKVFWLIVFALALFFVFYYFNNIKKQEEVKVSCEEKWYRVELVDHSVYYGLLCDLTDDPLVLKEVYYNYDQLNKEKEDVKTKSLRLVKRGKENYGPEGTMNLVRSQVLYMEPLREDSKVLKAIKNYENN